MEGPTYSHPVRATYSYGLLNFAAGNLTNFMVPPPRARNGRVVDIHVRATITFTNVTTAAIVNIGTVATPAKYATLNLGALVAGSAANFVTTGGTPFNEALVNFLDINFDRDLVTQVQLQVLAPTGGGPAGTGYLDVFMAWF